MLLRLLVDVDVERPVREVERLRELALDCGCRGLVAGCGFDPAPAAAGGEQAGDGQHGCACGAPADQLAPRVVGQFGSSKTNVDSGLNVSVTELPGPI